MPLLNQSRLRVFEGVIRLADRLTDRAGDAWKRLTRSRRRRNCKKLAQMARTILKAKDQVHQLAAELASAASGYVCLVDDAAELLVVGMIVAPDDVPADHAGLLLVAGVVGAVQREVPQRPELRLYAV